MLLIKHIKPLISIYLLFTIFIIAGCGNDDEPAITITASDFSTTIDENPEEGQVIGTVQASVTGGSNLSFSIVSQLPANAMEIDAASGELIVAESTLFDYEVNPDLQATIEVSANGTESTTVTATVNLNDIDELGPGFVTTWQTTTANESITIPVNSNSEYTYNYDVNWGDGNTSQSVTSDASHTYAEAGIYQVAITGSFPSLFHGKAGSSPEKLLTIVQWGNIVWQTMDFAFSGCVNLTLEATDVPDLSQVTVLSNMFQTNRMFNGEIGDWDISNIKDIGGMFANATIFNADISSWNVSNVVDMGGVFRNAPAFNADISGWDVSSATSMLSLFRQASSFDQDLGSWDISKVTDMRLMFDDSGMSVSNYDATLIGWSQLPTVPSNIELGAQGLQYSAAGEAARQFLVDQKKWTITGDSKQ